MTTPCGTCRKIMTTLLAAAMLTGIAGSAGAVDFKATGEWLMGFGIGESNPVHKKRDAAGWQRADSDDQFMANQRLRLKVDAVASEALSGTVFLEIGEQHWGDWSEGGAMGADGTMVRVKNAYLDWTVPRTDLKLRMGIQTVIPPTAVGDSKIMKGDVAAVVAGYEFNDNVGISATWMRPVNDNYAGWRPGNGSGVRDANYLDNIDVFLLSLPLTFDGVKITPWVMYGMMGRNALSGLNDVTYRNDRDYVRSAWATANGTPYHTLTGLYPGFNTVNGGLGGTGKSYGSLFWAGLPIVLTAFDPLRVEIDLNYGFAEAMGRFDVMKRSNPADIVRGSTRREGWLAMALVEYKMDWGTPGVFGWYGSGDDGSVKNGSERMASLAPASDITSFLGDNSYFDWTPHGTWHDRNLSLAGSWGVGARVKDVSFVEDVRHTFRVAYWGGTNSPAMAKYMKNSWGWSVGYGASDGAYMTTNDGMLEFNLINQWKIYENLEANLELGYVVNMMDKDTWKKGYMNDSYKKQDLWKAHITFAYKF